MLDARLSDNVAEKVLTGSLSADDVAVLAEPTGINLAKLAIQYADGVIAGVPDVDPRLMKAVQQQGLPVLSYVPVCKESGPYVQAYNQFYDDLLKDKR
jgi:starch synthase